VIDVILALIVWFIVGLIIALSLRNFWHK